MAWRKRKLPRTRRQIIMAALRNLENAPPTVRPAEANRTLRRAYKNLRAALMRER